MNSDRIPRPSPKAARLLRFLVTEIAKGRIQKGDPQTFIAYSEALSGMGIPAQGRAGQQLLREGLGDLNDWLRTYSALPKITGLIVLKKTRRPSGGFAKSHGWLGDDWEDWWLAETAKSIVFDWAPYLANGESAQGAASSVREDGDSYPRCMSTITAIFEPAADGTLHLPVPEAWRTLSIRVKAELEPVTQAPKPAGQANLKGFGCLRGKVSMAPDFDEPLEDFKDYMR